jgi:CubicO group peptidase (beta-lactamase class C family)
MRLVEQGKLNLDEPIRNLLPAFHVRDVDASRRTTMRTLLTHMGGWEGDLFEDTGTGDDALSRMIDRMATLEQIAPFNMGWSYNNAGFYAAGRVVEVLTKKSYEDAIRDLVIQPLGLSHSFFFPHEVMTYRFAVGHAGPPSRPIVIRPWSVPRAINPAGGVVASIADLLSYAEFQLGDGATPSGSRLLSPATMRRMHQTQLVKQGTDDEMALGWQVTHLDSIRVLWHDGSAVGQNALAMVIPSRAIAIALVTNSVRGEALGRDARRAVARELLGIVETDPGSIAMTPGVIAEYVGRYSRPFMDIVVTADSGRLLIQRIQKRGFPTAASPVAPPGAPAPYALYGKDRLVGLGAVAGDRVEFLRAPDGRVQWIRVAGRVARRSDPSGLPRN